MVRSTLGRPEDNFDLIFLADLFVLLCSLSSRRVFFLSSSPFVRSSWLTQTLLRLTLNFFVLQSLAHQLSPRTPPNSHPNPLQNKSRRDDLFVCLSLSSPSYYSSFSRRTPQTSYSLSFLVFRLRRRILHLPILHLSVLRLGRRGGFRLGGVCRAGRVGRRD